MSRYKGRTGLKSLERDFPHFVDMMVPEGGFGTRLDAMHDWHHARGIQVMRGRGWRDENNRDHIRWCFADAGTAKAFAAEFALWII